MIMTITSGSTTVENAWGLVGNVVWSGDKQRAARTLSFDLATSQADPNLPAVECPVGATVSFWDDNKTPVFQGQVVTRQLEDTQAMVPIVAHDRGRFLAGNDGTEKIRDETPESAVARICANYGIPVGKPATTGASVRRKFVRTSLWNIVTSLYTLASRQTGQQYMARFEWDKLVVSVRSESAENLVIQPQSNLLSSRTVESIEDMRNSVGIYDKDGNRLSTVQDEDAVALYGLLEKHITQQDGQDTQQEAKQILRDQGLSQTISVSCMGDLRLTTGKTVVVRQPVTGLSGVLWIESDQHVWNGGNYTTNLTLNLRNLMYETETGSELK